MPLFLQLLIQENGTEEYIQVQNVLHSIYMYMYYTILATLVLKFCEENKRQNQTARFSGE